MSNTHIIISCLVAVGVALLTVSYVNSMQTRKRLIQQRLAQLKRKVAEKEELASVIEPLLGSTEIEKIVLEDILDTLKGMQQLSPGSTSLEISVESIIKRLDEVNDPAYHARLNRVLDSDAQIARARYQLGEAGRIVRKRQAAGLIELARMNTFIEELAWAHLMVLVVSLVAQGQKAMTNSNVLRAYSFYKKAQEGAMAGNVKDERRYQLIKELGEMQSGNRTSLSIDLMPEAVTD